MGDALDDLDRRCSTSSSSRSTCSAASSPTRTAQRVFGGQVAAQALVAAGRTVDADRPVHSLHAYFLRPGDPTVPIVYEVDRIRDGRSFTTRRVVAIQHGQAIFNLSASFHVDEAGPEHQDAMPDVPDARDAADVPRAARAVRRPRSRADRSTGSRRERPIDHASVASCRAGSIPSRPREPEQDVWFRANGTLPDDPLLHACVVAYASDLTLLDTAVLPHADSCGRRPVHDREPRPRDVVPPAVPRRRVAAVPPAQPVGRGAARGFADGSVFRADGTLAVTVMQEGLIRPVRATDVSAMPSTDGASTSAPTPSPRPTPEMRARDGRRRGRRRRVRRGPDGQPAASRWRPALLGKEAALYVPSGTMANQLALRVLGAPGTEVLCGERGRTCTATSARRPPANARRAAPPARPTPTARSTPTTSTRALAAQRAPPARRSRAVRDREHPHARERPAVAPAPRSTRSRPSRRARRLAVHCDGARIWNAADRARRRRRATLVARRRHRDVLPLEGAGRAGRVAAVRDAPT